MRTLETAARVCFYLSPILVSVLALLFTILAFWWMNWRSGPLLVTRPNSFVAHSSETKLILTLPLVFFNSGAKAKLVEDLSLQVLIAETTIDLFFNALLDKLGSDENRRFAAGFGIEGGSVQA